MHQDSHQCSRPNLAKSFNISNRSDEEMSQWRCSLISVNIHGLISAPRPIISEETCQIPPNPNSTD
jgi:hypothetical protein